MKNLIFKTTQSLIIIAAFSLAMVSCGQSGQGEALLKRQNEQKKFEAIGKISLICDKAEVNQGGIRKILDFAKKASANFETFVYLAQMANEFGYHTEAFVVTIKLKSSKIYLSEEINILFVIERETLRKLVEIWKEHEVDAELTTITESPCQRYSQPKDNQ